MFYLVHIDNNSMAAHSPDVNVKVFKKCHISNTMDETDDDMLWHDNKEDGDVRSECEEDEGNHCEDGDSDTDW
jgi:hypothetical protein